MAAAALFLLELMLAVSAAGLASGLLGYRPIIAATLVLPVVLIGSGFMALVP
ncbi:hypothetical protein [Methylobacterium brachiatum]|uniref:hypothetical protein n=1 Tax=Methylobacterium brachiatum TaxID=269660 RepID=UPI00244CC9DA|nr:hypothetical protein [Methylobacterium brachiatum]MDH2313368.1 hypothetical protein [Methylobacterium brachiatum]